MDILDSGVQRSWCSAAFLGHPESSGIGQLGWCRGYCHGVDTGLWVQVGSGKW